MSGSILYSREKRMFFKVILHFYTCVDTIPNRHNERQETLTIVWIGYNFKLISVECIIMIEN